MKALAYIGGFLALFGALFFIWNNGRVFERNKLNLETANANNVALETALKERDNAYSELQRIEDEILASPETDDGPLAPVLARELDRVWQ